MAWQPAAASEPQEPEVLGSQMITQYVGVVAPFTSSTHWPLDDAGTAGGIFLGHALPARHLGEHTSPEMPLMDTFISVDMQPPAGSP